MKRLLFMSALLFALLLAACGSSEQEAAGGAETGGDAGSGAASQEAAPSPTPIVLTTPTPRPAPPTPTRRPTVAPIQSAAGSAEPTEEAAEAETGPPAESGPLFEDMVSIPAGPFTMGSDSSKPKNGPAHEVELPAFEIDRFPVTNDEFAYFAEQTGYTTYAEENGAKNWRDAAEGKGNHPVVYINWDDAAAYCDWAGKRLPAEAEWEKAARGDDGRVYPWGNDFVVEYGNFEESGIRGTTAVGSFPAGASPYGVEDMAGNVREWTADYLLPYPGQSADADRYFGEELRVHRGGGWFDGEEDERVTTYNRNAGPPTSVNDDIGFRCARDAQS